MTAAAPLREADVATTVRRRVGSNAEADLAPVPPRLIDDDQWSREWGAA